MSRLSNDGGADEYAKLQRRNFIRQQPRHHQQHLHQQQSQHQQQQQQRASAFFFAELNTDLATYADPAAISDASGAKCRFCTCCFGGGGGGGGGGAIVASRGTVSVLAGRHAIRWDRRLLLRLLPLHAALALVLAAAEAAAVASAASITEAVEPAVRCCLYTVTLALLCGAVGFVTSRRFHPGSHAGAVSALDLACTALICVAALPLSASAPAALPTGLWQVAPLLLSVLCLLPLPLLLTAGYCAMLATGFTVCAGLLAYRRCAVGSPLPICDHLRATFWNSLAGCVLVQLAVLSVGALLQRSRDSDLVASLRHARTYIGSRVALEHQTDKLDRLVTSLVPQSLAAELKLNCLRGFVGFDGCRVAQASGVAVVSACIDGLTNFPAASFAAADAARLLHQLLCHMDHITMDYQGYRGCFDGDAFLVTFGFPLATDACRPQQALQFSLALHEFVSGLAERSHLPLTLRVGIACGSVSGCVLGRQRIVYGLVGEAADAAESLQRLCQPGRILVSRATYVEIAAPGISAETGPVLSPETGGVGGLATVSIWTERLQAQLRRFIQRQQQQRQPPSPASPSASSSVSPETRRRGDRLLRLLRATSMPTSTAVNQSPSSLLTLLLRETPFDFLVEAGGDAGPSNGAAPDGKFQINGDASPSMGDSLNSSAATAAAASAAAPADAVTEEAVSGWLLERCGRSLGPLTSKVPKMHWLTMSFDSNQLEREYRQQEDRGFLVAMTTTGLVLLISGCLHVAVLPRTTLLLMLFMISFTWTGMLLMVLLAARLKCLEFNIQKSHLVRTVIVVVTILLTYSMSQTNVLCCRLSLLNATASGPFFRHQPSSAPSTSGAFSEDFGQDDLTCPSPAFICLAGLLCLLLPPAFPGLPALAQQLLAFIIAAGFAATSAGTHRPLFELWDAALVSTGENGTAAHPMPVLPQLPPTLSGGLLALAMSALVVTCLARLRTAARREAFAWAYQTTDSQLEVLLVKEACNSLVRNLLPQPVASAILQQSRVSRHFLQSLCVEEHLLIGVLHIDLCVVSASSPAAAAASPGLTGHAGRCLANLTALIDELLDQQQQQQQQASAAVGELSKIRCTGRASVRLAVGLHRRLRDTPASKLFHLAQLLQFACLLRRRLPADCGHGCRLRLRMGAHLGSGFTALIGSVRPIFDLWGEAARVANALAGAGEPGQLLVSERVHTLARQQFDFAPHPAVWLDGARWPAMALRDQPVPVHHHQEHQQQQQPQLHLLRQLRQQNRLSAPCFPQHPPPPPPHPPHPGQQPQQRPAAAVRRPGHYLDRRRRDSRVHSVVRPMPGGPALAPLLPLQPLPQLPPVPPPLPRSTSIDRSGAAAAEPVTSSNGFDFPDYRRPSSPPRSSTIVDRIAVSSMETSSIREQPLLPPSPSQLPLQSANPQEQEEDDNEDSIVVSLMSLTAVEDNDDEIDDTEAAERLRMLRPDEAAAMSAMQRSGDSDCLGAFVSDLEESDDNHHLVGGRGGGAEDIEHRLLDSLALVEATSTAAPSIAISIQPPGSGPASESNYDNLSSDGGGSGGTAEMRIAFEARRLRRLALLDSRENSQGNSPVDIPGDSRAGLRVNSCVDSRVSSLADSRLDFTTDSQVDSRVDSPVDSRFDSRGNSLLEFRSDSRMDSSLSEGEIPAELIAPLGWQRSDRNRARDRRHQLQPPRERQGSQEGGRP